MNLYLRLLWTLFRSWRATRLEPGDTLTRTLRVLPNDLDINGHMNNGRYLTIIDLMLVEYFVRTGFAAMMLRQGWRPMAGGSFITYRRGLMPFQTYTLRFRLDASDAHWNYMRFEFVRGERVCAAGYMKGAAVARTGLVPNAESYGAMGRAAPPAALPAPVRDWLAAEHGVINAAW
ncbi:MAG: acyl-CoA thioesterase [Burkholderiales bacterium]|nr:acyl-CoA thioesterase [Burkholderiales bacterium]